MELLCMQMQRFDDHNFYFVQFLWGYGKNNGQQIIVYAYTMILQGETPVQSVPMPWFIQTIKNRIGVFLILLFPGSVILNSQIIER